MIKKLRSRWVFSGLVPIFVLAHFSHHVLSSLLVPLTPFIRDEFSLDYTQSGLLISAFTLTYGISQIPVGWFGDRLGPRILIAIGISGVAAAGLLVGLSQTYVMLIVFLVLMGIMGGGYHPAAPALIAASVTPENRGRALGFHLVGGTASGFLAPIIAATIAVAWGWRASYLSLAIPTVLIGILIYVLMGRYIVSMKAKPKKTESPSDPPPTETQFTAGSLGKLAAFMIMTILAATIIRPIRAFLPLFMVDQFGVSKQTAALFLVIMSSSGFWAAPLGGYLSDRLGRVRVILTALFLVGPAVFLLNYVPFGIGFGVVIVLISTLMTMTRPSAQAYILEHTPERHHSKIMAIYFAADNESAGLFVPLMGILIDQFGFYFSFTVVAATVVAVALLYVVFLRFNRS
ncbi:MAG: MFS transporter [Chloroflexi bacterium]|nr:MFS transporter [Chloroflexota bacterium]